MCESDKINKLLIDHHSRAFKGDNMFETLLSINEKPKPFQYYTADDLWTDEYISKQMLQYHLNESVDISSRKGQFIQKSVDWMIQRFQIDDNKSIVDFGCGPGLYTNKLAKRGAVVTGIDFSKRSLEYAAKIAESSCLTVDYIHCDYLRFETEKQFDLISMIYCDFCALSPKQRKHLLGIFHKILKEDGAILLDVHTLNAFRNKKEVAGYAFNYMNHFWSSEDYFCFYNTFLYEEKKVSLDKYTIIKKTSTNVIYNWLQFYSKEAIIREFKENGFEVKEIYSNVAGTAYHSESNDMAIVAKKQ